MQTETPSGAPVPLDVSKAVARARERLDRLPLTRRRFGIVQLWPDQAVAEHENIARLTQAAEMIGASVVLIGRQGEVLSEGGRPVRDDEVDFVLHLHFETPKTYDALSIGALWNPMAFYFDWGFRKFWTNQMSHDAFAWTGSEQIRRFLRLQRGRAADAMPLLNHTLAHPAYVPQERDRYGAFYCGINWSKVGARKGRHEGVLKALDAAGRLEVYGPREIQGMPVWDGYRGYRGPLPFDGASVVEKARDAGATLVFSSKAHIASGVMSNRLFEAMAAGSVILGDDHAFIPAAVGDAFVRVPVEQSEEAQARFIIEALDDFGRDPTRAVAIARKAQQAFLDRFFLCDQIAGLFATAAAVKERRATLVASRPRPVVAIIIQALNRSQAEVAGFLGHLKAQLGGAAEFVVLSSAPAGPGTEGAKWVPIPPAKGRRLLNATEALAFAAPALSADTVCFMIGIERIYGETFLSACTEFAGHPVGRLGHLRRNTLDRDAEPDVAYRGTSLDDDIDNDPAIASYIFDRAWLESHSDIPEISARGLLRIAMREDIEIPQFFPTALEVDDDAYRGLQEAEIDWHEWKGSESAFIDAALARQGGALSGPDAMSLKPSELAPITRGDDIGGEVANALRSLPRSERLNLARGMILALSPPPWMLRLARRLRRIFAPPGQS